METLFALNLVLKEELNDLDVEEIKEKLIFKHIEAVTREKWAIEDFPKGNILT